MTNTHENWTLDEGVKASSNRTFGLVFTAFFLFVALIPLRRHQPMRGWAAVLSVAFCLAALAAPAILAPLNRAWTALGRVLHRITNPIILGILFYLVFTPLGWLLRRMGKSFLRSSREPDAASYWIVRQPPGPDPASIANQF